MIGPGLGGFLRERTGTAMGLYIFFYQTFAAPEREASGEEVGTYIQSLGLGRDVV